MNRKGFPGGSGGKESSSNAGDPGSIPGSGRSLKKGMATHLSILAWRIPWTEEPSRLRFMGSQRVGHDWATNTFTFWTVKHEQWGQTSGSSPGSMACLPKPWFSHCEMELIILPSSWSCWEGNMGEFRVFSKQVVIDNMHRVLWGPNGRGRELLLCRGRRLERFLHFTCYEPNLERTVI